MLWTDLGCRGLRSVHRSSSLTLQAGHLHSSSGQLQGFSQFAALLRNPSTAFGSVQKICSHSKSVHGVTGQLRSVQRQLLPGNAAAYFSKQDELSQFSKQLCQQTFWRPTRLKASAAASVSDQGSVLRKSSSINDSSTSKRDRQSELVHPLFSKDRQKEKAVGEARASKPSVTGSPAKRSSKPGPKPVKASEKSAVGLTLAEVDSKQASRSQSRKPARAEAEAPAASKAQQAASSQGAKDAKERGPKNQVAFAPQPTKLRMAPISPDAIADPYQGVPPKIQWLDYLGRKGWSERRKRILDVARTVYAIATIRRKLDLKAADFKEIAIELYYRINRSLSHSDLTALRQLTTPQEMSRMKHQTKLRSNLKWSEVKWSVAKDLQPSDIEIVQARVLALRPEHDAFTFAQLTVKVSAEIRFAAYGSSGEIVKGDPRKSMKTTDYWVLERSFVKAPSAKWRLASQINNVPAGQRKGLFQRMLF